MSIPRAFVIASIAGQLIGQGGLRAQAAESAAPLTLPVAIERALQRDPKAHAARARQDEALATRQSVRGQYGPKLQVDANVFYWNEPHDFSAVDTSHLNLSTIPPTLMTSLAPLLGTLSQPIRFRDQLTAQAQATLVQPITPLYSVYQGSRAAQAGEQATEHQARQAERELTFRVTEAYYRLLMARHLSAVADSAVATLRAHWDQAKQYRDAEMLGQDEFLAVEVELGNAVENQIKARAGLQMANTLLAVLIGAPLDQPCTVVDVPDDVEPPAPGNLDDLRDNATHERSEIAALKAATEASRAQGKAAWWQLTPQLSALARYQHTKGSAMNSPDELFAGAVLSWNVWDWGATYYKARAAEAQVRQAQARTAEVEDLVRLEITQRALTIDAARERLRAARSALRQANEALRVSRLKFEQHTVSSTAVLDAQTRFSRAEANRINAQYELIIAVAALRLAMGENVTPAVLPTELQVAHD
jgi:outer membrane protein TolC